MADCNESTVPTAGTCELADGPELGSGGCVNDDVSDKQIECSSAECTGVGDPPNGDHCTADADDKESTTCCREMVELKVIYNKQKFDVKLGIDDTVDALKRCIEELTDVPVAMQKIMYKGRMNDEATLRECKVTNGAKIMLIGSTVNDIMSVNEPSAKSPKQTDKLDATPTSEPLCKQKAHKTVLDKYGKPEDVMPGVRARPEPLPAFPISGMYNKSGGKVRLTFKLEAGQLWLGTKVRVQLRLQKNDDDDDMAMMEEPSPSSFFYNHGCRSKIEELGPEQNEERTEKLSLSSIKSVISEPIEGHVEYHMMALQLGPTEASRYWIYWVPAQYVDAIKDAILGGWQYF